MCPQTALFCTRANNLYLFVLGSQQVSMGGEGQCQVGAQDGWCPSGEERVLEEGGLAQVGPAPHPVLDSMQSKAVEMTWRVWATCSCISTWAPCPGRASKRPPSARSMSASVRRKCRRPSRSSAKATPVSSPVGRRPAWGPPKASQRAGQSHTAQPRPLLPQRQHVNGTCSVTAPASLPATSREAVC